MGGFIRVDSGIDSTDVTEIDESLIETSFIVEMDSRLGQLVSVDGTELPGSINWMMTLWQPIVLQELQALLLL